MRQIFLILFILLFFTSCSTTLIYSPKTIVFHGNKNYIDLKGSELKENDLNQESKPKVKIKAPLI